jgi:phosphoribosylcarboxyaminoimidazole (NCAIR) mutase
VGSNGSKNAAILCAQILALFDADVAKKLYAYREELRNG